MKKQILFLMAIMIPALAFTQDLVSLKSGTTFYKCKILREDSLNVYFQYKEFSKFASKEDIQIYMHNYKRQLDVLEEKSPKDFYAYKIHKYTRMKHTGTALGLTGGVLTVVGLFLVANADWEMEDTSTSTSAGTSYNTHSASGGVGVLCVIGGVATTTVGIVLGARGSKKVKNYRSMLNDVSFNFICTPEKQGIALRYRF